MGTADCTRTTAGWCHRHHRNLKVCYGELHDSIRALEAENTRLNQERIELAKGTALLVAEVEGLRDGLKFIRNGNWGEASGYAAKTLKRAALARKKGAK